MVTFLLTLIVFVLAIAGLGLGVMLGRRPPAGGCGGCVLCLVRRENDD